jgi:hypothetical protein
VSNKYYKVHPKANTIVAEKWYQVSKVCGAEGNSKKGWERVAAKHEKETRSRANEL